MNLQQLATDIAASYIPPVTGRPSEIGNPETLEIFLTAVEAGNYIETACEIADIGRETYRIWTKRAEDGEEPFATLVGTVKRASALAEATEVQKVRSAGNDPRFWAASMTYLERRHPERWARRSEEGNAPRVVVQIGVRDSDVQVRIEGASPAALPPLSLGEGQ